MPGRSNLGLNRTSVGLKRGKGPRGACAGWGPQSNQRGIETQQYQTVHPRFLRPQSNQRGIETTHLQHSGRGNQGRLNRTSVGLKHRTTTPELSWTLRPQSNQRGIETGVFRIPSSGRYQPQSNQRGIETLLQEAWAISRRKRLNRTSVGLKPQAPRGPFPPALVPQSNQRGIET